VNTTTGGGAVVGLTGATGHIGGLLLRRLLDDPEVSHVRSVARRPLSPAQLSPAQLSPAQLSSAQLSSAQAGGAPAAINTDKLSHTRADLREPAARRALEGVDLLYHLGAQVWQAHWRRSRRSPGAGPYNMYGTNVEGTRNVVRARPGALVFASSAAVYGAWPDNPLPIDEAHQPRPNVECPYALYKLVAEQAAAAEVPRHVVVRLTAVLGAHADARVARAVHGYHLAVPAIAGAAQALQWLDEADAVEGLLAAGRALLAQSNMTGPDIAGTVVNLATADWLEATDVARLARSRVVALPRGLVINGAELGRHLGWSPFGADRAVLIAGPLALSAAQAAQRLGWRATKTSAEVLVKALEDNWDRLPRNRSQT
jgi:nucleoside-diphosphate-sugar epimerase